MIRQFLRQYSNKFVSRWVILLFDIFSTIVAFATAYILRFNFKYSEIGDNEFYTHLGIAITAYLIGFLIFKPFAGIIRHTSLEDVFKLINASLVASAALLAGTLLLRISPDYTLYQIPISIIIIHLVFTLAVLISSRFFIKTFYHNIMKKASNSSNVLIYGAGSTGILTKHALGREQGKKFNIVAFADDNETKRGKSIEGVRIFGPDAIDQEFIEKKRIHEVILAMHNIHPDRKRKILDKLIQYDVELKNVPKVKDWINGTFSSRQIKKVDIEDLLERDPINLNNESVREQIKGKVIMVTGAAGSIGSEIVRQLMHYKPGKLILVDQAESALFELEMELKKLFPTSNNCCLTCIADICNETRMRALVNDTRPDKIYHAAAYKHVPLMEANPYEAIRTNIIGTKILADLACEFSVSNFVFVSTDKAVNPTNVMGATKRTAEMYIQTLHDNCENDVTFTITRFGNVLGSNGSVVPLFQRQIDEGGPITVTHRDVTRFFMTIPEACQLVLDAGAMGRGGEIFVFDMGKPVKIYDIAKKMIRLSGLELNEDISIEVTGLRPGEKLYEEVLMDEENTMKTYHPKIKIATARRADVNKVNGVLDNMRDLLDQNNDYELVKNLKKLVPEFRSRNSVYERLDQKVNVNRKQQVSS